jgi:hypothetical protein
MVGVRSLHGAGFRQRPAVLVKVGYRKLFVDRDLKCR